MPGIIEESGTQPSVCIIGGGLSGMCGAIKLQKELGWTNFDIFEMHDYLGGTWAVNKYPGCANDVAIHAYCYTFEKRHSWRAQYATAEEIYAYQKEVAEKYDLVKHCQFRHLVKRVEWIKEKFQWKATIKNLETDVIFIKHYDIVISATGPLRSPRIPEEFKSFKGKLMHTAEWDPEVDLKGRRVGVVGTGASGIQVIPEISKKASNLVIFQRKPCWVFPKIDFEFGRVSKFLFKFIPGFLTLYQIFLFHTFELLWHAMKKNSFGNRTATRICNWYRRRQLGPRQDLYDALTPNFPFGCKRTGFASNYYPVFTKDSTTLVTSNIGTVNDTSITTEDGKLYQIDVLVLATGFRITDYFAPLEIFDINGTNLLTEWRKNAPSLFLGTAHPNCPNMFILFGPNSATGHNSVVWTVEMQMNFLIHSLRQMIRHKARIVLIKKNVVQEYMDEVRSVSPKMVWSGTSCSPWYVDEEGRNVTIFPWNLQNLRKRVKSFDYVHNLKFDVS